MVSRAGCDLPTICEEFACRAASPAEARRGDALPQRGAVVSPTGCGARGAAVGRPCGQTSSLSAGSFPFTPGVWAHTCWQARAASCNQVTQHFTEFMKGLRFEWLPPLLTNLGPSTSMLPRSMRWRSRSPSPTRSIWCLPSTALATRLLGRSPHGRSQRWLSIPLAPCPSAALQVRACSSTNMRVTVWAPSARPMAHRSCQLWFEACYGLFSRRGLHR